MLSLLNHFVVEGLHVADHLHVFRGGKDEEINHISCNSVVDDEKITRTERVNIDLLQDFWTGEDSTTDQWKRNRDCSSLQPYGAASNP